MAGSALSDTFGGIAGQISLGLLSDTYRVSQLHPALL